MKKSVELFLEDSRFKKDPQRHSSYKAMRRQAETLEHIRKLKEERST